MTFAYVLSQYPARSETFIAREIQALVDAGHQVHILRMRWSDTATGVEVQGASVSPVLLRPDCVARGLAWVARGGRDEGAAIARMIRALPATWGMRLRLAGVGLAACAGAAWLHGKQVDHVRAHFMDVEATGAFWMSELLGCSFSITVQTTTCRLPESLLQSILEAASLRVATTTETRRFLSEQCPSEPQTTVRSGLRTANIPVRPATTAHNPFRVLAVGRLIPKKGFDLLIRACARIRHDLNAARGQPPWSLTIIGDGPRRHDVERLARELSVQDAVTFRGALPFQDVQDAYTQADLLVVPSRRDAETSDTDGLPNVLIEASAAGLPVVGTRIGGIQDLVQSGETGILVPPDDVTALVRGIERVQADYGAALDRARRAQAYVRSHFDLDGEVARLVDVIRKTTDAQNVPASTSKNG